MKETHEKPPRAAALAYGMPAPAPAPMAMAPASSSATLLALRGCRSGAFYSQCSCGLCPQVFWLLNSARKWEQVMPTASCSPSLRWADSRWCRSGSNCFETGPRGATATNFVDSRGCAGREKVLGLGSFLAFVCCGRRVLHESACCPLRWVLSRRMCTPPHRSSVWLRSTWANSTAKAMQL